MTITFARRAFSVLLVFASGVCVQAQPPGPVSPSDPRAAPDPPAQTRMQEDIEVMRLILGRTFQRLEATPSASDWKSGVLGMIGYGDYGGLSNTQAALAGMSAAGMKWQSGFDSGTVDQGYPSGFGSMSGFPLTDVKGWISGRHSTADAAVEGFYLPGYGIVFTASLPHALCPAHGSVPLPEPAQPKPRVWDQVRRELSGAAPPDTAAERKTADVSEWVLQVLAENGSNLSQLGESERVAILISFRRDDPRLSNRESSATPGPVIDVYPGTSETRSSDGSGPLPGPQGPQGPPGPQGPQGFPGAGAGPAPTGVGFPATGLAAGDSSVLAGTGWRIKVRADVQNYELLGDLHLKQGKPKEAAESYQKAADIQPRLELLTKLAQALLAAGHVSDARQALERAATLAAGGGGTGGGSPEAGTGNAGDESTFPLPRKLIISARKSLLDQVGAGNISPEGFRQQVSVQSF
jgi:hypothetical protein